MPNLMRDWPIRHIARNLSCALLAGVVAVALSAPASADQMDDLKAQSEILQQQILKQQEMIEEMQRKMEELARSSDQAQETARKAEEAVVAKPAITSGNKRIKLAISGHVNRMVNVADDGNQTKVYHVDNSNSQTRIRFVGTGQVTDELTLGTVMEGGWSSNSSGSVNQKNEDTGSASLTDRKLEAYFDHKRFGRITIGQGDTASNNTAEVDLSGTDVISYASISDTAGGLLFYDDKTDELSSTKVSNGFNDFDGLSRQDRLRYDTPRYMGIMLSGSAIADDRYDMAVTWSGKTDDFKMGAAAAWWNTNKSDVDYGVDGSASVLHDPTGLNLTLSGAKQMGDGDRDDAWTTYIKAGWKTDFFDFGKTAFSVDYTYNEDVDQDGDEGKSFGIAAVQNLTDYGTQFYVNFRNYDLDRDNTNFDSINVFSAGTRVKF